MLIYIYVYMYGLKYSYMCMSTFTYIGAFLGNVDCICGCCLLVILCFLFSFEISVELDTILSHVKDFISLFAWLLIQRLLREIKHTRWTAPTAAFSYFLSFFHWSTQAYPSSMKNAAFILFVFFLILCMTIVIDMNTICSSINISSGWLMTSIILIL